jgi:hypothetical protein
MRSAVWADEVAAASLQEIDHDEVEPESLVGRSAMVDLLADDGEPKHTGHLVEAWQRVPRAGVAFNNPACRNW